MPANINRNGLLAGQVAVITGASRGIGAAIAYRYAQEGAKVVVSARTLQDGDHLLEGGINNVATTINEAGGIALAIQTDLNLKDHRIKLIEQARKAFGDIDILVNNGAVTYYSPVHDFSEKRYRLMMDVQVYAAFHLCQLVLPAMIARRSGRIVNVSSHAAIHPAKDVGSRGGTVYGMCKAALERMTTGLAAEVYEDNIGVNVISPGLVATPGVVYHNLITAESRSQVTPVEHMAEACLHLVTGEASENTGAVTYAADVMSEFNLDASELLAN